MDFGLPLKLVMVFAVVTGAFYFWYVDEGSSVDLGGIEDPLSNLVPSGASGLFGETGLMNESYCPFVNPYMSQLLTAGSISVSPGNPLHDGLCYVITEDVGVECEVPISADYNYGENVYEITLFVGHESEEDSGRRVIENPEDVSSYDVETLSTKDLASRLNDYARESEMTMFLEGEMPGWQCYLFFGMMPFITMFLFLRDILNIAFLSRRMKTLITLFASLLAVITGSFAKFTWQIAYLASISIQGTLLIFMLTMGMMSVILNWIGSIGRAMGSASRQTAKVSAGMVQNAGLDALHRAMGGEDED